MKMEILTSIGSHKCHKQWIPERIPWNPQRIKWKSKYSECNDAQKKHILFNWIPWPAIKLILFFTTFYHVLKKHAWMFCSKHQTKRHIIFINEWFWVRLITNTSQQNWIHFVSMYVVRGIYNSLSLVTVC